MSVEADETRTLHVATDRAGRTWRILEREDDSFSIYYTKADSPAHHVIYDSLDTWSDPPRVVLARAEKAEAKARRLEAALVELIWACANGDFYPALAFDDARRALGNADPLRHIRGPVEEE